MSKRCFDLVIAVIVLVLALPFLMIAAILIKIDSSGPVLHRTVRVGRNRRPFTLLKLRSMVVSSAAAGPAITSSGDLRITRFGRFCRHYKVDELPQLWNVIRGDMSLVGPRPEDPKYVQWYTERQLALFSWRPGITSPASVAYRDEEEILAALVSDGRSLEQAYRQVQEKKLDIELSYFPTATLRQDILWLARTIAAIPGH